jgi:hypothetical protein
MRLQTLLSNAGVAPIFTVVWKWSWFLFGPFSLPMDTRISRIGAKNAAPSRHARPNEYGQLESNLQLLAHRYRAPRGACCQRPRQWLS